MDKTIIENIQVGDEIYFKSDNFQNFDLYWIVKTKDGDNLEIEINEMGATDRRWISVKDVVRVTKVNFK